MTAEKTIQTINAILTAYAEEAARMGEESSYINKALEEVKNDPAGWTMRNPDYKNASGSYKLFGACAAVLMDARSGLRNDTTSRETVAALKRIINNTPDNIKSWKGICPVKDKYIICDGVRAVELLEDVPELPRAEHPEAMPNLERIWTCEENKTPLVKPEKAEIKAYLAAEKAAGRGKASAPAHPYPITAEGGAVLYMANPSYILDMIDALPGGAWYATGKTSPVYIEAENGRGILLPVMPEAEKRAEIAENWNRINSPAPAKKAEEPAPEAEDESRTEEATAEAPQNAPESTEAPEAEETTAETAESEIEPEEAAETPAPAYTITKNAKYNSLEISFQSKPSAEVREALKALRFRWNGKAGIWYGYATEEATRAAIEGKEAGDSWHDLGGATTAPNGYKWQSNGKSRFSGEYKNRLVKTEAETPEPQDHIKIYYNGIKIDGGKLIKCGYSINTPDTVCIYARNYDDLPRDLFEVKNDSDPYTDYFENDRAVVESDHPLYKYIHYAALKEAAKSSQRYIEKYLKPQLAAPERFSGSHNFYRGELERHEKNISLYQAAHDPGQPTAADLEAIDRQRQEAENERRAAEHREELIRREIYLQQRSRHHFITETAEKYPLLPGAPVVIVNWSEHPGFIWADDELKLSVKAAEKVLSALDEEEHDRRGERGGYFKTSFTIKWTDESGEECSYSGRYDLGDGDGGLIKHIRALGKWQLTHDGFGHEIPAEEETNDYLKVADFLETFAA